MKDLNFSKGFVKSGTKNVSEVEPVLMLTSTYSNFKLNNKAMAVLELDINERIAMFDQVADIANQSDRYYICKAGFEIDGVEQGALVSVARNFRYSGIYNTILNDDVEVTSISANDLVERGLMVKQGNLYIARQTIAFKLTPVNDGEPVEVAEGVERVLYKLTSPTVSEHTPKAIRNTSNYETTEVEGEEPNNEEE